MTMARLMAASWKTVLRRSLLMARGACSAAEYQRMTAEKIAAVQTATRAFQSHDPANPWHVDEWCTTSQGGHGIISRMNGSTGCWYRESRIALS
jgi:hypothetical protein